MNAALILSLALLGQPQQWERAPGDQFGRPAEQVAPGQDVPDEGDPADPSYNAYTIQVFNKWQPRVAQVGTGVIVGHENGHALVLTAGHVFLDGSLTNKKVGTVWVERADGKKFNGKYLASDHAVDLAAIEVDMPGDACRGLTVAKEMPKSGAWLIGYGMSHRMHVHYGYFTGYRKDTGQALYQIRIDQGDSGAPIVNEEGKLVSIGTSVYTQGIPGNPTGAASLSQIKTFLAQPKCFRWFRRPEQP